MKFRPYRLRISSLALPSLALMALTACLVMVSIHYLSLRFRADKESELAMHVDRISSALKAQIFERYADSQAFALNPDLTLALADPSAANIQKAEQTLDKLAKLYSVYDLSVLTDPKGKVIAIGSAGSINQDQLKIMRNSSGISTEAWLDDERSTVPHTVIRDFAFWPDLEPVFGKLPVQVFSSPIFSSTVATANNDRKMVTSRLIGVISNYTTGRYIEREMRSEVQWLLTSGLPLRKIRIYNDTRDLIAVFSGSTTQYFKKQSEPASLLRESSNLTVSRTLVDERLINSPQWRVDLEADKELFFQEVERLRTLSYLVAIVLLAAAFYLTFILHRHRMRLERESFVRIQEAQEAERSRLAREVHDDLGQTIAAIKIFVMRVFGKPNGVKQQDLEELKSMLDAATEGIRRISHDLHPSLIENFGLVPAIRWRLKQVREQNDLETDLRLPEDFDLADLSRPVCVQIYRIFQEFLTNVRKHSKATRICVSFLRQGRRLICQFEDNGVGLESSHKDIHSVENQTLGLRSMAERVQLIGGSIRIESEPGSGVKIICSVPIPQKLVNKQELYCEETT